MSARLLLVSFTSAHFKTLTLSNSFCGVPTRFERVTFAFEGQGPDNAMTKARAHQMATISECRGKPNCLFYSIGSLDGEGA